MLIIQHCHVFEYVVWPILDICELVKQFPENVFYNVLQLVDASDDRVERCDACTP